MDSIRHMKSKIDFKITFGLDNKWICYDARTMRFHLFVIRLSFGHETCMNVTLIILWEINKRMQNICSESQFRTQTTNFLFFEMRNWSTTPHINIYIMTCVRESHIKSHGKKWIYRERELEQKKRTVNNNRSIKKKNKH